MKTRFNCFHVSAEFLVNAVVRLGYCLVGIVNTATTDARHPCSHTSTTLPPAVKAFSVARHFCLKGIGLGQFDMFGFSSESFILFLHFESL